MGCCLMLAPAVLRQWYSCLVLVWFRLVLAQIQSISSLYISPVRSDPLLFGIMVAVLMWRPQGLFGRLGHG